VTRPKLILGVLAAACVGTLLWYAWLVALGVLALRVPRRATAPAHALVPASA